MIRNAGGYNGLRGLLQGIARGYKGLLEITRVTRDCKGLQVITRGYNGFQGVIRDYKGLQ